MGNSLTLDEINLDLHEAAERGDLREVKKYLQKGGDLNKLIERDGEKTREDQKEKRVPRQGENEEGEEHERKDDILIEQEKQEEKIRRRMSRRKPQKKNIRMDALHRATSRKNNTEVVNFILKRIANVDEQDSNGDTALHYAAAFHNNIEPITLLLKSKPNINLQNDQGETAMFSAISYGCDLAIIERLLREGANPNIPNIEGDTALHMCALRCGIDPLIPGILLRYGANPNLQNNYGQTALHVAAETTNNAVLLLLKFNAKVRLRDNNGRRPSEVAVSEEIRKILQEEETDLLARTTRTSDIYEAEEVATFLRSRPQSSRSVRSWLNDQEYDESKSGKLSDENTTINRVLYPRRSMRSDTSSYQGRVSHWDPDSSGGCLGAGGVGRLVLPQNKEIVIPPDAVPKGTFLKFTIKSNDPAAKMPNFEDFDFEFDLRIQLPGTSFLSSWMNDIRSRNPSLVVQPGFSGMCLEGNTSWKCAREITDDPGSDVKLNFCMKKESCVPLVQSVSVKNALHGIESNIEDDTQDGKLHKDHSDVSRKEDPEVTAGSDEENNLDETDSDEIFANGDLSSGNFWARQVVVVKESSETSGSCDESEGDSYIDAGESYVSEQILEDDDMILQYGDRVMESEENPRIQHPIDYELETIREEDVANFQYFSGHEIHKNRKEEYHGNGDTFCDSEINFHENKDSTPSLDSGYRGSLEIDE